MHISLYSAATGTLRPLSYVDALIIYSNRHRFSESNAPEYHLNHLRNIVYIAVGISVSNGAHKSSTPPEMGEYDYLSGEALSYWSSSPNWRICNVRLLVNRNPSSVSSSRLSLSHKNLKWDSQYLPLRGCHVSVCTVLSPRCAKFTLCLIWREGVWRNIQTSMIRYGFGPYPYCTASDNSHHGSEWQYTPYSSWTYSSQPRSSLLFVWVACSDRLSSLIYLAWWYLYVWAFYPILEGSLTIDSASVTTTIHQHFPVWFVPWLSTHKSDKSDKCLSGRTRRR